MKGQKTGGRQKGTPNRVTAQVRAVALRLLDESYLAKLQRRLASKRGVAPAVEVMLWHYAHGKPKETVKVEGGLKAFTLRILTQGDHADA